MTKYIDADALEKRLNKRLKWLSDTEKHDNPYEVGYTEGYDEAVDDVKKSPAADVVEVVYARWEQNDYDCLMDRIVCSCCKKEWNVLDNCTEDFYYCPNCGAKVDKEE